MPGQECQASHLHWHDRLLLRRQKGRDHHREDAPGSADRLAQPLRSGQGRFRGDSAGAIPRAGSARGHLPAGNRHRPRWQSASLGRRHVVVELGLPGLGPGEQPASPGLGRGRRQCLGRRTQGTRDRRRIIQPGCRFNHQCQRLLERSRRRGRSVVPENLDASLEVLRDRPDEMGCQAGGPSSGPEEA